MLELPVVKGIEAVQGHDRFRISGEQFDRQVSLWVDRQLFVVIRIEEKYKLDDGVNVERVRSYEVSLDGEIDPKVFEFEPPK
jgi:hypothetical protein